MPRTNLLWESLHQAAVITPRIQFKSPTIVEDLANLRQDLKKYQQLVGCIIAIIQAGHLAKIDDLTRTVRTVTGLSQFAAHVRNECRASVPIQKAFDQIDFEIDGPTILPSPV
jgi:hypothetical protein